LDNKNYYLFNQEKVLVICWDKLDNEQAIEKISLKYRKEDHTIANYCPDFIVETKDVKYLIETKDNRQMSAKDVLSKKEVAKQWCEVASEYELKRNGKSWHYVLIPSNSVNSISSFDKLVQN
jgi:DNA-directed RNA polymerase subunit L